MFYKVKSVEALEDLILYVTFENGEEKYYDVKPILNKIKIFQKLADSPELFKQIKVDIGGYGISWNDELDLSCNELWNNGMHKK